MTYLLNLVPMATRAIDTKTLPAARCPNKTTHTAAKMEPQPEPENVIEDAYVKSMPYNHHHSPSTFFYYSLVPPLRY